MKKAVLLIIDMINDGFEGWDESARKTLTTHVNELADIFRAQELPVIWVLQEYEPDLSDAFLEMRKHQIHKYIKGTDGVNILPELKVAATDLEIVKKRYSAFFGTDLDNILTPYKTNLLVLAGINTHACVRTTAIDAYQRDYETIVAIDSVGSYHQGWHNSSLEYLNGKVASLKTNVELKAMLT